VLTHAAATATTSVQSRRLQIRLSADRVEITGADRQKVGQLAAEIAQPASARGPTGMGIKYSRLEKIRRKEGRRSRATAP